jgi:hypothetical protein
MADQQVFESPQEIRKVPHVFDGKTYVKDENFTPGKYPKMKYHADYIHPQKEGVEYSITQSPILVHSAKEERELGDEWKDSPTEHGIITAPDADQVKARRAEQVKAGANWRAALPNAPDADLGQRHIDFLQAQGMADLKTMGDLYAFVGKFTGAQMKSFMAEVAAWKQPKKA